MATKSSIAIREAAAKQDIAQQLFALAVVQDEIKARLERIETAITALGVVLQRTSGAPSSAASGTASRGNKG